MQSAISRLKMRAILPPSPKTSHNLAYTPRDTFSPCLVRMQL
jgi:hypothetical protein